ncbi:MAG: lyase family protein [Pseudomonadota bacterium]
MISYSDHPWMSGLFGDPEIDVRFSADTELAQYLRIEAAWTRALGAISDDAKGEEVAKAIEMASIAPVDLKDGFARDGVPIPALVKALRRLVGPDAEHLVHHGLTSQDVMDTALVLTLTEVLGIVGARLKRLDADLSALTGVHGSAEIMGYTRMQPALTVAVAEVIARWQQSIPGLLTQGTAAIDGLAVIQWGGPVGVREHSKAKELGAVFASNLSLSDPGRAWHTDRSRILSAMNFISQVTVMAGKIGEDLALMSAIGPSQVVLKGGGSSAMPHKVNPVKAEVLITLADRAALLQAASLRAARHEGLRSGQAWTMEWQTVAEACAVAASSTRLAIDLIAEIESFGA